MPKQLTWDEKYSVGVDEIDAQHKEFLEILAAMYAAIYAHKIEEEWPSLLEKLEAHVHTHFATEEAYFKKYNYPETEEHAGQHQLLTQKATDYINRYDPKNTALLLELLDFLEDWFVIHSEGHDLKYAEYFAKIGVPKDEKLAPVVEN